MNIKELFIKKNSEGIIRLNHASFGYSPEIILKAVKELNDLQDINYNSFFHEKLFPKMEESNKYLAKILSCDEKNCVYTKNTSASVQTVLNSFAKAQRKRKIHIEKIVSSNHEYSSIDIMTQEFAKEFNLKTVKINIGRLSSSETVEKIVEAVGEDTLLILPYITSPWAELLDIKSILSYIPENAFVIIDAAHYMADGLIDTDIYKRAFLATSLHKWNFFHRSCGALCVPDVYKDMVYPNVASWYYNDAEMFKRFSWQGTENLTNTLIGKEVYDFHNILYKEYSWDKGLKLKKYALSQLENFDNIQYIEKNRDVSNMLSFYINIDKENMYDLKAQAIKEGIEIWLGEADGRFVMRLSFAPYVLEEDLRYFFYFLRRYFNGK